MTMSWAQRESRFLWDDHSELGCPRGPDHSATMAQHRHLSKAPVREALIDIQFQPNIALELVQEFANQALKSYAKKTDVWQAYVNLSEAGGSPVAESKHAVLGSRLDSADGSFVLQARVNGFTVSRLHPYGQWADLKGEAMKWWEEFTGLVGGVSITRIAVRYINSIDLPLPLNDFSDYLTCAPTVPPSLPQGLSGFLYRVEFSDADASCTSIVTQAIEGPPREKDGVYNVPIILDIDVVRLASEYPDKMNDLWDGLEELRSQKNRIFFEYITERTAEMYE